MTDSNAPDETTANRDPFDRFSDWLVDGSAGKWPNWQDAESLNENHAEIAKRNAWKLKDRKAWLELVRAFESALSGYSRDETLREAKRARYAIHFDKFDFSGWSEGETNFSELTFPCSVHFTDAQFGDAKVDFSAARFGPGPVSFRGAQFGSGDVRFDKADFGHGGVTFWGAKFHGEQVSFQEARFGIGDVSFVGARIPNGVLSLTMLSIPGRLYCIGLVAKGLQIADARIGGTLNVSGSEFATVPNFVDAEFERPPDVSRMEVPAPELARLFQEQDPRTGKLVERAYFFERVVDQGAVFKLRKLKAMAIAASDHEKDGLFFAYEMMAKRGVEHKSFWQLLANSAYRQLSFYGQSYLRPLSWMVGNFGVFAGLYALMAALPIGGWNSVWFGITYSFKNSLPFLGTITRSVPSLDGHTSWLAHQLAAFRKAQPGLDWLTVLGTGQAILSLFFFFFLLLGLRNRFRLK